jgi:hypothetical protein
MFAAESGEEYTSMLTHIANESQIKFMSGIVDIMVADTPLAFGTVKKCNVKAFFTPTNLEGYIRIKLPVDHSKYQNLSGEEIHEQSSCFFK